MEQNGTLTLSRDEMLELWRLRRHLEPLSLPAGVTRTDGLDTEALLLGEIDRWHEEQLQTLPPHLLPQENIAAKCRQTPLHNGALLIELPDNVVRVVSIAASGWCSDAIIVDSPDHPLAQIQLNPYACGTIFAPVAVKGNRTLTVYASPQCTAVQSLICITRPAPGTYILTPAMMPPLFDEQTI